MAKNTLIAIAALASAAIGATAEAETLKIYSVEAPPMTMEAPMERGFVADITIEALKRAGYEAEMIFIPWPRGQQEVAEGENLLIIPFARSAAREAKYTWIAPIFTVERSFATLGKSVDSFDQAKAELKSILVGQGTAQEDLLKSEGFSPSQTQVVRVGRNETDLLGMERADAWFNGTPETLWKWKKSGRAEKLTIGKAVAASDVYLGCSLKCSPEIVGKLQTAIKSMVEDGSAQRLTDKYLK
jgi:polar amino acid transport system substrate-binding protein